MSIKKYAIETGAYGISKGLLKGNLLYEFHQPMDLLWQAGESFGYDMYLEHRLPHVIPEDILGNRGKEIQKSLVLTGGKAGLSYIMGKSVNGRALLEELAAQGLSFEIVRFVRPYV